MKECTKCGESKELTDYSSRTDKGKTTIRAQCIPCRAGVTSAWHTSKGDERKVYKRTHHLKTTYGISLGDYASMYESQLGCCAICGIEEKNAARQRLVVDHDHETLAIRSLLCGQCNVGLGQFKDNQDFLANAITYLKRHDV